MQMLLICAHESGQAAFAAKWIEGIPAPERRYQIIDHRVVLDNGFADAIIHHDVEELLRNPLYRMPTPAEQEAWMHTEQKKTVLEEDDTPVAPPAVSKKKAS